jgi:hypothetical protein
MENSDANVAVHIKNSQGYAREIESFAGLMCGLFGLPAIWSAAHGEWGALGLLAIPVVALTLSYAIRRMTPEDYAVLYSDRVELPGCRKPYRIFKWSEVEKIRWPSMHGSRGGRVQIVVPHRSRLSYPQIDLDSRCVSLADRIAIIRYLRLAGANVPHEGWPGFCRWCAVPSVEKFRRGESTADGAERDTAARVKVLVRRFDRLSQRSPFLAGVISPLAFPLYLLIHVSRKAWWTFAALLAISAAISGPLIWGWNLPVLAWVVGIPLAMFIFGSLAPVSPSTSTDRGNAVPGGLFWVVAFTIGLPLLLAASVRGWVPRQFGQFAPAAFFLSLLAPLIVSVRHQARNRPQQECEAIERWAQYEIDERKHEDTGAPETPSL